ncbi:MAG: hypothetical protein CMP22_00220 [Rickettsiales bacterium]|nr:hypothetical protein [Rickettsiales bacterium]|tara:strand:+ start:6149 stop:7774 length:1626 start_codon:yes stop_codon:yes gene_type:complete
MANEQNSDDKKEYPLAVLDQEEQAQNHGHEHAQPDAPEEQPASNTEFTAEPKNAQNSKEFPKDKDDEINAAAKEKAATMSKSDEYFSKKEEEEEAEAERRREELREKIGQFKAFMESLGVDEANSNMDEAKYGEFGNAIGQMGFHKGKLQIMAADQSGMIISNGKGIRFKGNQMTMTSALCIAGQALSQGWENTKVHGDVNEKMMVVAAHIKLDKRATVEISPELAQQIHDAKVEAAKENGETYEGEPSTRASMDDLKFAAKEGILDAEGYQKLSFGLIQEYGRNISQGKQVLKGNLKQAPDGTFTDPQQLKTMYRLSGADNVKFGEPKNKNDIKAEEGEPKQDVISKDPDPLRLTHEEGEPNKSAPLATLNTGGQVQASSKDFMSRTHKDFMDQAESIIRDIEQNAEAADNLEDKVLFNKAKEDFKSAMSKGYEFEKNFHDKGNYMNSSPEIKAQAQAEFQDGVKKMMDANMKAAKTTNLREKAAFLAEGAHQFEFGMDKAQSVGKPKLALGHDPSVSKPNEQENKNKRDNKGPGTGMAM